MDAVIEKKRERDRQTYPVVVRSKNEALRRCDTRYGLLMLRRNKQQVQPRCLGALKRQQTGSKNNIVYQEIFFLKKAVHCTLERTCRCTLLRMSQCDDARMRMG